MKHLYLSLALLALLSAACASSQSDSGEPVDARWDLGQGERVDYDYRNTSEVEHRHFVALVGEGVPAPDTSFARTVYRARGELDIQGMFEGEAAEVRIECPHMNVVEYVDDVEYVKDGQSFHQDWITELNSERKSLDKKGWLQIMHFPVPRKALALGEEDTLEIILALDEYVPGAKAEGLYFVRFEGKEQEGGHEILLFSTRMMLDLHPDHKLGPDRKKVMEMFRLRGEGNSRFDLTEGHTVLTQVQYIQDVAFTDRVPALEGEEREYTDLRSTTDMQIRWMEEPER